MLSHTNSPHIKLGSYYGYSKERNGKYDFIVRCTEPYTGPDSFGGVIVRSSLEVYKKGDYSSKWSTGYPGFEPVSIIEAFGFREKFRNILESCKNFIKL